jgi:hypothetical protein
VKVIVGEDSPIELGATEAAPTIGIVDYSRRVTDEFGVTTVVERGFSRRMSVRLALPFDDVDGVQRLLADLRATAAQWVADDDFEWLKPTGFYKDFEIDLNVPPLSFCTLTVEGLAESAAVADPGDDPAPEGSTSTLRMLLPVAMTDAALASSTVPEADNPVWAAGVTYPLGGRVIRTDTHRIYESLAAGNIGHDPSSSPSYWLDVGPTNRWAMFDEALGTATAVEGGPIVVTFDAGAIGAVALIDVLAASVQVEVIAAGDVDPTYDRTIAVTGGTIGFYDLPDIDGTVRVTVAGIGPLSVGTLLIGALVGLGITEASPTAGIADFSRKDVDDFGEVTIVQRAWAKRMTAKALIRTDALDVVADRIAAVRARPVLWIGDAGLDSLTLYGFFRDFGIEVGETVSKLSLSIEGLSKAQPLEAPWAADIAAIRTQIGLISSDGLLNAGEKPQAIIDWNALSANYVALNNRYLALGSPADIAPSRNDAATKVNALNVYLAGLAPDWTDTAQDTPIDPALYQQRWIEAYTAIATFQAAITGRVGAGGTPGLNNAPVYAYQRSASGTPALPSATVTYDFAAKSLTGLNNGWSATIPAGSNPLYITAATASSTGGNDTIASGEWAAAVLWTKDGDPGANGLSTATAYLYQRNNSGVAPAAPSVTSTWTFATATLAGFNNGWSQTVPDEANGKYLFVTTAMALALATLPQDTIAAGEWAVVRRLAKDGDPGLNGLANAPVYAYQRSASGAPALPSATVSYDFSTKALTGLNNGWTATIPAGSNPLYITAATASSNTGADTIAAGEWAGAVLWVSNGAPGDPGAPALNSAPVILLQRNNTGTPPAAPSATTTYTFATASLAGINNGWSQAMPDPSLGQYLFWTQATALSTGTQDTIAAGEWTAPKQVVKDGEDGQDGMVFSVSTPAITVAADYLGTAKASQFPITFSCKFIKGGVDLSGSATFTVPAKSNNDAAKASTLVVSIGSVTAEGWIDVRCQYGGVFDQTIRVPVTVQRDQSPAQQGVAQQTTNAMGAFNASGGTSYPAQPVYIMTVRADGSGQLNFAYGYSYSINPPSTLGSRSARCATKIVYRVAGSGGAWIDGTAEIVALPATSRRFEIAPGEQDTEQTVGTGSDNQTKTGLTASGDYEVGMMLRNWGSDPVGVVQLFGSFTAKQP